MLFQNLPNNYFCSLDDFYISEYSKGIGIGSFGSVKKATHKYTNKVYAIKIIDLTQNQSSTQNFLLQRQINIHYQFDHPHIIKLWAAFRKNNRIYMVLDYAKNGNLFSHCKTNKNFSELDSFYIFYQLVQAVDYMHKKNVFHRDLKLQNILLDHDLNVKICDFGWVADDIHKKRTTFCGTYQYMAPEMIQSNPYDYKVDIWALGILLYELNHGHAPFQASSAEGIKQKLKKGVYEIKQNISESLKQLIVGILQFNPEKRMNMRAIIESEWMMKNRKIVNRLFDDKKLEQFAETKCNSINRDSLMKTCKKKNHKKYRTLEEEDFDKLESANLAKNLTSKKLSILRAKENNTHQINQILSDNKNKKSLKNLKLVYNLENNESSHKRLSKMLIMNEQIKGFQKELRKKKQLYKR